MSTVDHQRRRDLADLRNLMRDDVGVGRFESFFRHPSNLPRGPQWKDDEIKLLDRVGLAQREGYTFSSACRVHRVADVAGDIFITTDFPGHGEDQVFPWKDEAEVLLRHLRSKVPDDPCDRVLVMCCGAGTVALVLRRRWPRSTIVAVDNLDRAIERVRYNAELNGFYDDPRLEIRCADLFDRERQHDYGIIIADPPFALQPPGADGPLHSRGGPYGDSVLRRLLKEAPNYLRARDGRLITLAYWLGDENGTPDLEDLIRRTFYRGAKLPPGTIVPLKDELVWRVGEEKSFRNPMPIRYMIVRYNDPTYRVGSVVSVRDYESWIEGLVKENKTHLHYLLIDVVDRDS